MAVEQAQAVALRAAQSTLPGRNSGGVTTTVMRALIREYLYVLENIRVQQEFGPTYRAQLVLGRNQTICHGEY